MIAPLEIPAARRCFSTLGCVELNFPQILGLAAEFGIPAIELRGFSGRMDMPQLCAELGLTPARVDELCRMHHTRLALAGSSVKLSTATPTDLAELIQFSAWADSLRIPYVRVFGGGTWGQPLHDADYAQAAQFVEAWRREQTARRWRVELLLETHDAFSTSAPCLELNRRLAEPLNLIWDSHHTWRLGGDPVQSTWRQIGGLVRHVHVKDSIDRPSARHPYTYVLPGEGQMPWNELILLLEREGFAGCISLEWERFWHPYLPPLREALARFKPANRATLEEKAAAS